MIYIDVITEGSHFTKAQEFCFSECSNLLPPEAYKWHRL